MHSASFNRRTMLTGTAALVAALSAETTTDSRVVALNAVDRLIWARSGAGVIVR